MGINRKHPIERKPDFNFKSINEISHLTIEQKEKLLNDVEYILSECELSRQMVTEEHEIDGHELDSDWVKRVNYKIGVKRNQKKMLQNNIRVLRGHEFLGTFHDIAKIMLPEDTFDAIKSKANQIVKKQKAALEGENDE